MKEITICFQGLGYNNKIQANVKIYNKNKKLIINQNTYNNKINVCLKEKEIYHLIAKSFNQIINTYIYINTNRYYFSFQKKIIKNNLITFLLKDYYYNLPIERGKLICKSQ